MKIRRLEIRNFRAIREKTLSFEDAFGKVRPVVVIAGPNGSGKSSILMAIVQALRDMAVNPSDVPPFDESDINRGDASGRDPVGAEVTVGLHYTDEEIERIRRFQRATIRAVLDETDPPDLPDALADSLVPSFVSNFEVEWRFPPRHETPNPLKVDQRKVFFQALRMAMLTTPLRPWSVEERSDTYSIGGLHYVGQERGPQPLIATNRPEVPPNPIDAPKSTDGDHRIPLSEALRRLGEWALGRLDEGDERRRWEGILQERFNRLCRPKEYRGYWLDHPRFGETPLLAEGSHEYPMDRAASGERVILHYLTMFTFPRPIRNSIVLIDEPELHLHPSWVRLLFRMLSQLAREDGNQFILTTHSSELRQLAAGQNWLIDLGDLDSEVGFRDLSDPSVEIVPPIPEPEESPVHA